MRRTANDENKRRHQTMRGGMNRNPDTCRGFAFLCIRYDAWYTDPGRDITRDGNSRTPLFN
jgi:hypothetical protein